MSNHAFHGGAFFDEIGVDFQTLERASDVISADVLDAWFDPSPKVVEKIREYLAFTLKTSPPIHSAGLIETISAIRGVPTKFLIAGAGSSDLMFVLFPSLLKDGDKVCILDPMYGEYAHIFTKIIKADLRCYALNKEKQFQADHSGIIDFIKKTEPKLVSLVNPNSPTGQYWPKEQIIDICRRFEGVLFTVDEAYIDYVGSEFSLEREVEKTPNLIVIKSMSKAYALSGARVAYLVCAESIQEKVNRYVPPWAVSLIGQIAGTEALRDSAYYAKKYKETHTTREAMTAGLSSINSIKVYPSCASFFIVELFNKKATQLVDDLRQKKLFIRHCDSMGRQFKNDFVRVSVKDQTTANTIVELMRQALAS